MKRKRTRGRNDAFYSILSIFVLLLTFDTLAVVMGLVNWSTDFCLRVGPGTLSP